MKRKFLSLLLVMILIATVFTLTGCGEEEGITSKAKKVVEGIEDADEDGERETFQSSSDKFNISSKNSDVSINAISDKQEIMIRNNAVYNYKGKKIFDLDRYSNSIYGSYIVASPSSIYDINGNKLPYNSTNSIVNISENGYVLSTRIEDTMATGQVTIYEIIDAKTNQTLVSTSQDFDFYDHFNKGNSEREKTKIAYTDLKDYFVISVHNVNDYLGDQKIYYNAKTNEWLYTFDKYNHVSAKGWKDIIELEYGKELLDFEYPYYDRETYYQKKILSLENKWIYNGNGKIVDFAGNELKDISEGEVQDINCINGKIQVRTKTEYFYVLDENLEYCVQPAKIVYDTTNFTNLEEPSYNLGNISVGASKPKVLITTEKGLFYITGQKSSEKDVNTYSVIVYDEKFNKLNTFEVSVKTWKQYVSNDSTASSKNQEPNLFATKYGLVANSTDGNAYIYQNDKTYTINNSALVRYKLYEKENKNYYSDCILKVCDGPIKFDESSKISQYNVSGYFNMKDILLYE